MKFTTRELTTLAVFGVIWGIGGMLADPSTAVTSFTVSTGQEGLTHGAAEQ